MGKGLDPVDISFNRTQLHVFDKDDFIFFPVAWHMAGPAALLRVLSHIRMAPEAGIVTVCFNPGFTVCLITQMRKAGFCRFILFKLGFSRDVAVKALQVFVP